MLNQENCSGVFIDGVFIEDKIQIYNDSPNADIIITKLNKLCKNKTEFNLKEKLKIQDLLAELELYYAIWNNNYLIKTLLNNNKINQHTKIIDEIKHIINCEKEIISIEKDQNTNEPRLQRNRMRLRFKHYIIIGALLYYIYFYIPELNTQFNLPFNLPFNLSYILYIILFLLVLFRPYDNYYPLDGLKEFAKYMYHPKLDEELFNCVKLTLNDNLNYILYKGRYINDKYISNKIKNIKYNLLSNDKDLINDSINDLFNSLA
jgi:hypothetical protein